MERGIHRKDVDLKTCSAVPINDVFSNNVQAPMTEEFRTEIVKNIPQQMNGSDCGKRVRPSRLICFTSSCSFSFCLVICALLRSWSVSLGSDFGI